MPERFFSIDEAERLLPEISELLRGAMESKKTADEVDSELFRVRTALAVAGGAIPDHARLARRRQEREQAVDHLRETVEQIARRGCLLKDLDTGLVDFPCLFQEREVYLCWKLGEAHIGFWHNVEDGFAGRKPVDREFLDGQRRRPN